ncbi:MAG: hypothetical protein V7L20_02685 [Nostoc sp.]
MQISYKHDYIKQVASLLWRSLSQVISEEVCKKIFNLFCVAIGVAVKRFRLIS